MKLFMHISFAESICFCAIAASFMICKYRLNELFAMTVFHRTDPQAIATATRVLLLSSTCMATVGYTLPVTLLTCLCMDLILTIRKPFSSKEKRYKWFIIYSYSLTLISIIVAASVSP